MSATLKELVTRVSPTWFRGNPATHISGVSHDSRNIQAGWAFVAVPGATSDGVRFVYDALSRGASVIVSERSPDAAIADARDRGLACASLDEVPWVTVPSARKALGPAASLVFGDPTKKLGLVGITGTNGKTTLTYLLESVIAHSGGEAGVIGTINYRCKGLEYAAARTTPEASDVQRLFAEMLRAGATHGIIEASSHGLALDRLRGCRFDVGVFTNLTQDHLDFHQDMEDYFAAKKLLFTRELAESSKNGAQAVVNWDDPYGKRLFQEVVGVPMMRFGVAPECEVRPLERALSKRGVRALVTTPRGDIEISSPLSGFFNLMNILAAIAASVALGLPVGAVAKGIAEAPPVPGRLERIESSYGAVFVDYAHTPLALRNVLEALRGVADGRIITVMGCGGDRDKTKRRPMGREAAKGSDIVVVTSDNPRSEDPLAIIAHVVEGVREAGFTEWTDEAPAVGSVGQRFLVRPDRGEALRWAVQTMGRDDIVLAAGKGHETYQEVKGVRRPFDDRETLRRELADLSKGTGTLG
jgi:UDP-N-acetylmuramoyl-L-alanyl-D-glutamate--2,6-diaminopimelate ligase